MVSYKSVLEPTTNLVVLGKWLDLLERMVGRMRLPACKCWWRGSSWQSSGRKTDLCNIFWASFTSRYGREARRALLMHGPNVGSTGDRLGILMRRSWSPLSFFRPWLLSCGVCPCLESKRYVGSRGYTDQIDPAGEVVGGAWACAFH